MEENKIEVRPKRWLLSEQSLYERVNSVQLYIANTMGAETSRQDGYSGNQDGDIDGEAVSLGLEGEYGFCKAETADSFQIRHCVQYVQADGRDLCAGCKRDRSEHDNADNYNKWDYAVCTELRQTDAYGDLIFPAAYTKRAKYVKVERDTDTHRMLNFLLSDRGFGLDAPQLILSVTGGAQQFTISEEIKAAFKLGLMKAAKTTNAWIISGGTNYGVMKLVGDAVSEDIHAYDALTVLGIATWGCVAHKDQLVRPENADVHAVRYFPQQKTNDKKSVPLNGDHSHFILVDNGSVGEFGVEIEFRTKLENELKKDYKTQMVVIVVEGGLGTLNTILFALRSNTPVILIADTKGCADLVRKAKDVPHGEDVRTLLGNRIKQSGVVRNEKDLEKTITQLEEIISPQYDHLMNVYRIGSEECALDIEPTILEALSKAETSAYQRILLSIKWNRYENAKKEIRNNWEKIQPEDQHRLLEIALVENRPNIVELILDKEINIMKFLTIKRLKRLHNYEARQHKKKNTEPFLVYLQKKKNAINIRITLYDIKKFLREHFYFIDFNYLPIYNLEDDEDDGYDEDSDGNYENDSSFEEDHEIYLFIWCILSGRVELAVTFWRLGSYQMCFSMIASRILKCFSDNLLDFVHLEKDSKEFEDLAMSLLKVYDKNTRDIINDVLVIRYIPMFGMDVLELAVHCKCKEFLSTSVIQNILKDIWVGKRYNYDELTDYEKELRKCQAQCNKDENSYIFKKINRIPRNPGVFTELRSLFSIPVIRFFINTISYVVFLLIFSFTMLFNFKYKTTEIRNVTVNGTEIEKTRVNANVSPMEILLLFWILALLFEETRQFTLRSSVTERSWKQKIKEYIENGWNVMDLYSCSLFIFGFFLRLVSLGTSENVFVWARIILSVDLAICYMRSLHFCLVLPSLGPKLLMIQKMVKDLSYFLLIILAFILAFGISIEAILAPYEEPTTKIFKDLINIAYWPIYGEIRLLDDIYECLDEKSDKPCEIGSEVAVYAILILLMIYMVIASVLLLNLLIAMFSSTFENIQKDSDVIWKNQRYNLILEYVDSPVIPAPLNFFTNLWRCGKTIYNSNKEREIQREYEGSLLYDYEQKCADEVLKEAKINSKEALNNQLEERLQRLEELLRIQNQRLTLSTR